MQYAGIYFVTGRAQDYEGSWALAASPEHVLYLAVVPLGVLLVSVSTVAVSVASYRRSRGVSRTFFALVGVLALLGSLVAGLEAALLLLKLTPWIPINGHGSSAMLLFPSLGPGWQELWRRSPRDSALTTRFPGAAISGTALSTATAFRSCGTVFSPREIVFNPTNGVNLGSYFPIAGPFPATGVDKVKVAIIGLDNLNTTLRYDIFGRAFNDPMARGSWTSLLGWTTPSPTTGDFTANTGELAVTGLSLGTKQWCELALGVRKNADADVNSRCIFQVIPAVKYA